MISISSISSSIRIISILSIVSIQWGAADRAALERRARKHAVHGHVEDAARPAEAY